jgi:glycosyltransferase involved in cell wall biosynthesis
MDFFSVGGTETYYNRIFGWAKSNGSRNILIVDSSYGVDRTNYDLLSKNNVEIYYSKWKHNKYMILDSDRRELKLSKEDRILCISNSYSGYFRGIYLKNVFRCVEFRNCLYILHPYEAVCINKAEKFKSEILNKINENNELLFMDSECYEYCKSYYKYKDKELKKNIILLSFNCKEYDDNFVERRLNKNIKHLLTVARFEFPFKGYVIGLLKVFAKLSEENDNVVLDIVGYGEGEELVKKTIKDYKLESKVNCVGKTSYEELQKYYQDAYIYVGMGTTLLDAANNSLPGIIVASYQYETEIRGEWYKNCLIVGEISKGNQRKDMLYDLIKEILSYTPEQYREVCIKTHKAFEQNYSIDTNFKRIVDLNSLQKTSISDEDLKYWEEKYNSYKKRRIIKDKIRKYVPKKILLIYKRIKNKK